VSGAIEATWITVRNYFGGVTRDYHFQPSDVAVARFRDAAKQRSGSRYEILGKLGEALHLLEDTGFDGPHSRGNKLPKRGGHGNAVNEDGSRSKPPWSTGTDAEKHSADQAFRNPAANRIQLLKIFNELKAACAAQNGTCNTDDSAALKAIDTVVSIKTKAAEGEFERGKERDDSYAKVLDAYKPWTTIDTSLP